VLLHTVFERVAIVKPVTSRPASAERFLVCMGLLVAGDLLLPVLNRLRAVCDVLRTQQQQQQQQQQQHQQQYYTDGGSTSSQWQEVCAADNADVDSTGTAGVDRVAAEAAGLATTTTVAATELEAAATESAAVLAAAPATAAALSSSSSDNSKQELCLIDAQLFTQIYTDSTSTIDCSSTAVSNVVQYLRAVNDTLLQLQVAACSAILTEADSGRFHDHESSIEYAVRHKRESTLQAACVQAWRLQ
jgi:hypothetical protein